MTLLQRYLGSTITKTTLLVLAVLLGLEIFILFVGQLRDLGSGDYGLLQAFVYVVIELPAQLYALFPMAGLLGALLGLSLLASHSELIVMRSAGLSLRQITRMVMQIVLLMVLLVTVVGEGLGPIAQHVAEQRKALAVSRGQALNTQQGVWVREGQNFIHIGTVYANNHLLDVSRYQFDHQHRLQMASYAKQAIYHDHQWKVSDIWQSRFSDRQVDSQYLPQAIWSLSLNPNLLKIVAIGMNEMSLAQLYAAIVYHKHNGLQASGYELAFWKRLLQPLATCVMMFLAIPFVFGPLRSATMGLRVLAGIIFGFSFYILNEFLGPISLVLQFPPFVAAFLPIALFALIGWLLLLRVH